MLLANNYDVSPTSLSCSWRLSSPQANKTRACVRCSFQAGVIKSPLHCVHIWEPLVMNCYLYLLPTSWVDTHSLMG